MKALSCALMFFACIFGLYAVGEEEARKGRELYVPSVALGCMALVAIQAWWKTLNRKD